MCNKFKWIWYLLNWRIYEFFSSSNFFFYKNCFYKNIFCAEVLHNIKRICNKFKWVWFFLNGRRYEFFSFPTHLFSWFYLFIFAVRISFFKKNFIKKIIDNKERIKRIYKNLNEFDILWIDDVIFFFFIEPLFIFFFFLWKLSYLKLVKKCCK